MPVNPFDQSVLRRLFKVLIGMSIGLMLSGCGAPPEPTPAPPVTPVTTNPVAPAVPVIARPDMLTAASLSGLSAQPISGDIRQTASRNEWVSTLILIRPPAGAGAITIEPLRNNVRAIDADSTVRVYQVLPVPTDVNRAGFVRHTGFPAAVEALPRALLPLKISQGQVDLATTRDPQKPADTNANALGSTEPILLWLDMQVPTDASPGQYTSSIALIDPTPVPAAQGNAPAARAPIATLGVTIEVLDFVLPDDRHLDMVAEVAWDALKRHWPERFEVIEPNLLSRKDPNHQKAVATLDEMMKLAQAHRGQIYVPRLQPTVKWPAMQPPQIDWQEFDGLLTPWMNGTAFADQVPIGYWPLPKIDYLENFAIQPRLEYYAAAASHFDQLTWLARAPVTIGNDLPGRASIEQRVTLSAEAQRVIASHPRVRVQVPLELDEVQIGDVRNPNLIDPQQTARLNCVAPGLISSSPLRKWPENLERPQTWLRTDLRGLIPYAGGGDQSDIRVWAWMASLRGARVVDWGNCLPTGNSLEQAADPSDMVWFYPGKWFGTDEVIPSVQLKWLRRAQQDFEYLYLAKERKSILNILPMARVLTKPVEIQAGQAPDPTYSLLIGTADPLAWKEASSLLGQIVMIRGPGIEVDENKLAALNLETLRWIEPLEKPVIIPRGTEWTVGAPEPGFIGPWVNLRLGLDIYNASDTNLDKNQLRFSKAGPGLVFLPEPIQIDKLTVYQVQRHFLNARVDPIRINPKTHTPTQVAFQSGFSGRDTAIDFVAPVSRSLRRTKPLIINGSLDDWHPDDAIQDQPLIKMFSRPAVQQHTLESATTPSQIFTGWSGSDLYFAFRVEGLSKRRDVLAARNFIDYQFGRAWGEDLCQIIIQAIYDDGTTGPLLHIAMKPGGNIWIERKLDPRLHVNPWENFNPGVRYATTLDQPQSIWRGEIAIPWASLIAPEKTDGFAKQGKPNLPVMLKLNFIQHKRDTGESASWAGPLDTSRDDRFTGVIVLKEPERSDTPDNPK